MNKTGRTRSGRFPYRSCLALCRFHHDRWPVLEALRMWWDDIGRIRGNRDECGCVWWLHKRRVWCMAHAMEDDE